jgi:hypothetical protein
MLESSWVALQEGLSSVSEWVSEWDASFWLRPSPQSFYNSFRKLVLFRISRSQQLWRRCVLTKLHRHFGVTYCLRLQSRWIRQTNNQPGFLSESGTSTFLRNVSRIPPGHMAYISQKTVLVRPYSVGIQGATIVKPTKRNPSFQNCCLKDSTKTKAKGMEHRRRRPWATRISLPV